MTLKPFNYGVVTKRILPFRALKNAAAQPLALTKILDIVAWGAKESLFEEVSFNDDDILAWTPETADDYKDKNNAIYTKANEIKAKLDKLNLTVASITVDLASHPVFAHGAFTNKDQQVRELARKKAERALEIGRVFNASLFVYDADSDGFDSTFTVDWHEAWKRLANGLDAVSGYANSQKMINYRGGCLAPRQSANFLFGFLNTPADALNLIQSQLRDRNFWGIAPSTSQLQAQGWDKAPASVATIAVQRRLAMLKIGGGIERYAKRAPHPILGTANLSETVQLFWLLDKMNWKGAVEYDNSASVADAKSTNDDMTCMQFVANCANALTVALQLTEKIKVDELSELTPTEADLMAATLIGNLDVDQVILRTIKDLPPTFESAKPQAQHQQQNQQRQQQPRQQQNDNQGKNRPNNGNNTPNNNNSRHHNNKDRQNQKPQQPANTPDTPAASETLPNLEQPALKAAPEQQALKAAPEQQALKAAPEQQALKAAPEQQALKAAPEQQALKPAPAVQAANPVETAPVVAEPAPAPAVSETASTVAESVPSAVAPAPVSEGVSAADEVPFLPDDKPVKAKPRTRRQPAKPRTGTKATAKKPTVRRTTPRKKPATDTPATGNTEN